MRRAAFLSLAVAVGCADGPDPVQVEVHTTPAHAVLDAANGSGASGFYFLPPLVADPSVSGVFDPTLTPRVLVCAWSGTRCGRVVADFSSAGAGSESVRTNAAEGHYIVNWDTDRCTSGPCSLPLGSVFRIRVLVGKAELGFADVELVASGKAAKNSSAGDAIPVVRGRTVPVKFRIEKGAATVVSPSQPVKIGLEGGAATTVDGGAGIVVPAGALLAEVEITIDKRPGVVLVRNADPSGAVHDFGPDGTTFERPVTIALSYDPASLPADVTEEMLGLYTVEEGRPVRVSGSRADAATARVVGETDHFSPYWVGWAQLHLVHHWPGDAHARDLQGGQDGVLLGGAAFAPGLSGQAFSFDGAAAHLDVGQPYDLSEGTLGFFFRRERENTTEVLTGSYNGAANRGPVFWFLAGGGEEVLVEFGNVFRARTGRRVGAGGWHHLAMTWVRQPSGSHEVRAYVDGTQAGSWTAGGLVDPARTFFGANNLGRATQFADALIDEIKVFDRALPGSEIENEASGGNPAGAAATIVVRPATLTLEPGQTATPWVEVHQANGYPAPRAPVTWTTSDAAVATVSAGGLVTAVAPGTASVVASAGGLQAVVTVTVPAPVELPLPATPELTVGDFHSCYLSTSGSAICWGENFWKNNDLPAGTYAAISTGHATTCLLRRDGVVWCRGLGIPEPGREFRAPDGRHIVQMDAGWQFPCGLSDIGTVVCWDQQGNRIPSILPEGSYSRVEPGQGYVCAQRPDGTMVCAGTNSHGQTQAPGVPLSGVSLLLAHACGLDAGGAIRCWGFNDFGQTAAPSGAYLDVSAGVRHSCALTTARAVRCWGADEGNSFASPPGPFVEIGAGWKHNCALTPEGLVRCWGNDQFGQTRVPAEIAAPLELPGLAHRWSGNGDALDPVGGLDGTLRGGAGFAPGREGLAFSFDGAGGYLEVGQPFDLAEGTVEFWVFRRRGNVREVFTGSYNGSANRTPTFYVVAEGDRLLVEMGDQFAIDTGRSIPRGVWHHLALTWSRLPTGGYTFTAYVDGTAVGTRTTGGLVDPGVTFFGAYNQRGSATQMADVLVDEIRVYDRALTAEEIRSR